MSTSDSGSKGEDSDKRKSQHDEPTAAVDPRQWPTKLRRRATITMGMFAFLEPFASSMIAPSLPLIAEEFGITSSVERSLVLSSFLLPYAFGTLLLAPISENVGRKPTLLISAGFFLVFTIACGFAQSSAQLIVFRVLAGFGGCAPLALGAAVVGDLYLPGERGSAMALYMGMQLGGPAIGPIVGGWIYQTINSWRWTFYVCAIATAVVLVTGTLTLPETYAPKLNRTKKTTLLHRVRTLGKPFILLGTQPIIQVLAAYAAIIFGTYYIFLTTIVGVFRDDYRQPVGIASLHYIALLLGFATSIAASATAMDALYRHFSKDHPLPEARIPYLGASGTFLPFGLLLYGWTTEYTVFWLVPDIGLFFIGMSIGPPLAAIQHYILDCYSSNGFAASALAAMNVARFLAGFGFPLFADELYHSLGLGWGNLLLALVAMVVGCLSVSLWKFGPRLREISSLTET